MVSRRLVLAGSGVVVAGLGTVGVTHPHAVRRLLLGDPSSAHPVPSGPVGEVVSGSFRSSAMRAVTGWSIAYPVGSPPGTGLPVMVVLHGRGDDHRDAFGSHHLDRFLSAAVRGGVPPFALAAVDGGADSYWHPRASGENPQGMLTDEFLPLLAARGLRVERVALGGWSMGGYGALLLAAKLGRARVAAVAVDSPALWARYADTARGAYDSAADFREHDVFSLLPSLSGLGVRVSCGTSDPFIGAVRTFLSRLPSARRDLAPGVHDVAWWQHAAPAQLAFAGAALTP